MSGRSRFRTGVFLGAVILAAQIRAFAKAEELGGFDVFVSPETGEESWEGWEENSSFAEMDANSETNSEETQPSIESSFDAGVDSQGVNENDSAEQSNRAEQETEEAVKKKERENTSSDSQNTNVFEDFGNEETGKAASISEAEGKETPEETLQGVNSPQNNKIEPSTAEEAELQAEQVLPSPAITQAVLSPSPSPSLSPSPSPTVTPGISREQKSSKSPTANAEKGEENKSTYTLLQIRRELAATAAYPEITLEHPEMLQVLSLRLNGTEAPWHWTGEKLIIERIPGEQSSCVEIVLLRECI